MPKQIAIGNRLYVFTSKYGHANDLLITAHGTYVPRPEFGRQRGAARNVPGLGGWIAVPNRTTLHFYSPHKTSLLDPGIWSIVTHAVVPVESVDQGGVVRNYRLRKFEGDTYAGIREGLTYEERVYGGHAMDILTIRGKLTNIAGVTLSDVLSDLREHGLQYRNIHCSFCRARTIGPSAVVEATKATKVSSVI